MAAIRSDEFKRDAVRIALTSGLTRRPIGMAEGHKPEPHRICAGLAGPGPIDRPDGAVGSHPLLEIGDGVEPVQGVAHQDGAAGPQDIAQARHQAASDTFGPVHLAQRIERA
ncbi:hypothetical protein [Paracoccus endophyticus]|uniref:hypothetical protein n=1 Tax=Paracoccus endophyticus TaxID=2233774 RepID=UPI000DDBEA0D|nr:hypothetical protein [Paracoccus endophyticus]